MTEGRLVEIKVTKATIVLTEAELASRAADRRAEAQQAGPPAAAGRGERGEADGLTTQTKRYRGDAYWQQEAPREADSGKIRVSFFAEAGKLQLSQLYADRASGELVRGKTVTLDQEDMQLHPEAAALVLKVLSEWRP
ncbi:MAG: hypothetical protein Q8P50_06005 [Bacillota bacterium]|nr:hypothetical protein [Bacillota bacterium]